MNRQVVDSKYIINTEKSYYNQEDSLNSKVITRDKNDRNFRLQSDHARFSDKVFKSDQILKSSGTNEPPIKNRKAANSELMTTGAQGMIFNLKITDLTRNDNPFVVFNDREIDSDGYLVIEEQSSSCLPWLESSS